MPADIRAERAFPVWIQRQFDAGRACHQWRESLRAPEPTPVARESVLRGINRPMRFSGNRRETLANLASHEWPDVHLQGDVIGTRCNRCQAKFVHAAAYYPCGQTPPRIQG